MFVRGASLLFPVLLGPPKDYMFSESKLARILYNNSVPPSSSIFMSKASFSELALELKVVEYLRNLSPSVQLRAVLRTQPPDQSALSQSSGCLGSNLSRHPQTGEVCMSQLPYAPHSFPCEDWTKELISEVNSPGAGSSWFFQDDRYVSCPVTKSHPKFMPGKYVSVRYSKLCQTEFSGLSGFPSSASLTTRFPESSNCAIGSFTDLEALVDHTTPLLPFTRTRIPGLMTLRIPVVLYRGASLLATQTYVLTDMFLYHMPTYRFFVLSGLKNPSSKVPLGDETMVSSPPSCRDRAVVMVSVALKLLLMGRSKDRRKNRNKQPFLDAFILPPLSIPFSEATEYNMMPFLFIDIVT
nr:hypothetical protein CR513_21790 [Ipomoea batatas]